MQLFAGAAVVIGGHGGGLTNVLWCRPGSVLVEFGLHEPHADYFEHLAAVAELRYHKVLPALRGGYQQPYTVDLGAARAALRSALSAS